MPPDFSSQFRSSFRQWWRETARAKGVTGATSLLLQELWGFLRDSTPERRRQRYGDMEYDWDERVNTTSGTVDWRTRLLGIFHSPYQPTDPALFREMMAALPIDFREFTFIDIGSGKGRTLLLASDYPFRRIVGVELIKELHRSAEENIAAFLSRKTAQYPALIESVCMDASEFPFPETPLLVYLFNPLPEARLRRTLQNLARSWESKPRPIWIVYHNPLLERVLAESSTFVKAVGATQYSVFRSVSGLLSSNTTESR